MTKMLKYQKVEDIKKEKKLSDQKSLIRKFRHKKNSCSRERPETTKTTTYAPTMVTEPSLPGLPRHLTLPARS